MAHPVALITGGASGIGLALGKHLLSQEWRVVLADVNEEAGKELVKDLGENVLFVPTDVASYEKQADLFDKAFTWGGNRLDFLAANAGIADTQFLHDTLEEFDENGRLKPINLRTMDVNLSAVIQGVWLFKHYARRNATPGGRIVITSSSAGLYPMSTNPLYTASKHALVGLTRALGPIFAKENIHVNAVCPAFVATGLCPSHMLTRFPKEHLTPMATMLEAYDRFIGEGELHGQTVEVSLDQLYFRTPPEYPNESQKWLGTESGSFWDEAYKEPVQ